MSYPKSVYILVSSAAGISGAIGFASGYYLLQKQLESKYSEISHEEIAQARTYYSRLYKTDDFADPIELANKHKQDEEEDISVTVETVEEIVEELEYRSSSTQDQEVEILLNMVAEAKASNKPYLISKKEFIENEIEHDQLTLVYYEDDDLLIDPSDSVVEDVDTLIGLAHLANFGDFKVLGDDNNIIYVRNETQRVDFEVIRSKGSYAKEVLGYIEHSDYIKVRKFRRDDE